MVWSLLDRLLMRALALYESALCAGCGQRRGLAMNPDMDGWFEAQPHVCFACAALEGAREKKDQPKGTKYFVVNGRPADDVPRPFLLDLRPEDEKAAG